MCLNDCSRCNRRVQTGSFVDGLPHGRLAFPESKSLLLGTVITRPLPNCRQSTWAPPHQVSQRGASMTLMGREGLASRCPITADLLGSRHASSALKWGGLGPELVVGRRVSRLCLRWNPRFVTEVDRGMGTALHRPDLVPPSPDRDPARVALVYPPPKSHRACPALHAFPSEGPSRRLSALSSTPFSCSRGRTPRLRLNAGLPRSMRSRGPAAPSQPREVTLRGWARGERSGCFTWLHIHGAGRWGDPPRPRRAGRFQSMSLMRGRSDRARHPRPDHRSGREGPDPETSRP
jgi:hypothetical protein